MRQASERLLIDTGGIGLTEITARIAAWVSSQGIGTGLLTVFCRHTSASLLIQENADPDVRRDLLAYFGRIAPESGDYIHDAEGADDMPAHIRTALTAVSLSIPIAGSRMVLGTWQGIYLFEHRRAPHRRELALHLIGESARSRILGMLGEKIGVIGMAGDPARNERALRNDLRPPGTHEIECALRQFRADAAPAKRGGDLGVGEDDFIAAADVGRDRDGTVDGEFEAVKIGIVANLGCHACSFRVRA
jgi:secondary thiamine-phosphate synthase enzyme